MLFLKCVRIIVPICVIFVMLLFSTTVISASSTTAQLFVFANTDNFVGIELRSSLDSYSNLFANIGVKYIGIGARISSRQTSGIFISPMVYFEYDSKANIALNVGYSFKISNFNNVVFLIEGGAKELMSKPEASLNFGIYLPF